MNEHTILVVHNNRRFNISRVFGVLLLLLLIISANPVQALTLNVVGVDNSVTPSVQAPVTSYRWLIEEDRTYHVPRNPDGSVSRNAFNEPLVDPNWTQGKTLAVSMHQSYVPVVAKGCVNMPVGTECNNLLFTPENGKHYFVSVLPANGYAMGGAQIAPGQDNVTIYVNRDPIPTAQISIRVHQDISPINAAWDQTEVGMAGVGIILEDGGGRYGISAGVQSLDVFGNSLGTTYLEPCPAGLTQYDPGCIDAVGSGIYTDADGNAIIKNLAPGKYGILAVPPGSVPVPGSPGEYMNDHWVQTSTIEGKKVIDAWVKAGEPPFFAEFGPPGPHISIGFVPAGPNNPMIDESVLTGGATLSGQVVNLHLSRPPDSTFHNGAPISQSIPWVGLNQGVAGAGDAVYAARANDDGTFSIPNVPPGAYQLVVWDSALNLIISYHGVTVNADGTSCNALANCDFGDVGVFQWFTRLENHIFEDLNENGFRDAGEGPLLEQAVNLRWRDGSVYQSFPTDAEGFVPFDEVFPFFNWLVTEVDFARLKATGVTITVDDGGAIDDTDPWSWGGQLNPQIQGNPLDPDSFLAGDPDIGGGPGAVYPPGNYRVELGPVLSQGFLGFLGQTSVFEWGKKDYAIGENGGISGVVMYAVTRAEDDPELAAAEPWEPGIPGVTVNLYSPGADALPNTADDVLLDTTTTDSWDDSIPSNCQYGAAGVPFMFRGEAIDCYDSLRNWNQVRPGVFDGGYAFGPEIDCPLVAGCPDWVTATADPEVGYMKPGMYIVEVIAPPGYEIIRSQDKNVDFGETYARDPRLLAPECVGDAYVVPNELSLFPGVPAARAGQSLPLCDKKAVPLDQGLNAAADFFLFTEVPVASHIIGTMLDDTANEFDVNSPQFGEKYAPPFVPVSIRDWTGQEIARTYSDEFGRYNALVHSTYTESLGKPSGISPNMLSVCMNGKVKADGTIDPLHNPQYSQFCYTLNFMPGTTTYLDTPVVPVAAFAGPDQSPLDCEYVQGTPRIASVTVANNGVGGGPYVSAAQAATGFTVVTINSQGNVAVPNPAYDGLGGTQPKVISRNYGFGAIQGSGSVYVGDVPLIIQSWNDNAITARLPAGITTGQLKVTRGDNGNETISSLTLQVGLREGASVATVSPGQSIQAAIDMAGPNDLILVAPGVYTEMLIMWKPVQLQGWGEGSTAIDALKGSADNLLAWRAKVNDLITMGEVDLVPGQANLNIGAQTEVLFSEEGAGVLVLASKRGPAAFGRRQNKGARIDGFTITGADTGGAVVINGYANHTQVSNNRMVNNSGFYSGGLRIGHPLTEEEKGIAVRYTDAQNGNVLVMNNQITLNGGIDGAGGGISICTGSDNYKVLGNFVCGNFTTMGGAGIAHYGLSENGLIADNEVLFNENFNQGLTVNGGGILISGQPSIGCVNCLSEGTGPVKVARNLIQGNAAGAGDGGGIRVNRANGEDLLDHKNEGSHTTSDFWSEIDISNNMIANNVSALAGAGISLQDVLNASIRHNTISNNDNASVAGESFTPGSPDASDAQPGAGIASRAHSLDMTNLGPAGALFSEPTVLANNIVWQNRKFFWKSETGTIFGLCPDIGGTLAGLNCPSNVPDYDDLAVLGVTGDLICTDCLLTGAGDPAFVAEYVNGDRDTSIQFPEDGVIGAPPALDEGGNFIRLRYGPLSQSFAGGALRGDYHITAGSPAHNAQPPASDVGIVDDFDSEIRPVGPIDIGADELQSNN